MIAGSAAKFFFGFGIFMVENPCVQIFSVRRRLTPLKPRIPNSEMPPYYELDGKRTGLKFVENENGYKMAEVQIRDD